MVFGMSDEESGDRHSESAVLGASVRPPTPAAPRASAAAMSGTAPGHKALPEAVTAGHSGQREDVAQARRELESIRRHHGSSGRSGSLRAAVFGINDGLVSNFSLVLGMAG